MVQRTQVWRGRSAPVGGGDQSDLLKSAAIGPDLFSASGGLVWHVRAFRNRSHWRDFRSAIEAWLRTWQHGRNKLLLLGPSAGWCLPTAFLGSFREIRAVDFDPLAPYLFSMLHGSYLRQQKTGISWCRANIVHDLDRLLRESPRYAVLFGNVLGQHRLHCATIASAEADIAALSSRLRGWPWASFHDRLSCAWEPSRDTPPPISSSTRLPSNLLAGKYEVASEWTDHLTECLLPADTACLYLPWYIEPNRLHVVEAAWCAE